MELFSINVSRKELDNSETKIKHKVLILSESALPFGLK
jgi:hypothetical protein